MSNGRFFWCCFVFPNDSDTYSVRYENGHYEDFNRDGTPTGGHMFPGLSIVKYQPCERPKGDYPCDPFSGRTFGRTADPNG